MSDGKPPQEPFRSDPKKSAANLAKFAGMGIQLAVAIGLGVVLGLKVDEKLGWRQPVGTALCSLLGLAAGMYQVLRSLR